ncbi:putative CENPB DNA-binding domain-containing protein 1 [Palaemon carinicauda]|uniref:putative CENPB DNA-binding domain-containing protein 1 n=1 Tax=Palaemon carinicauda TaxID=392227 RepID=UPI0035B5E571
MDPMNLRFGISSGEKRKKDMVSLELKQEFVEKHERGVRVSDLAKQYGRNMLTISMIIKQKAAIKADEPSKDITVIAKCRSPILVTMESLLLIWIKDKEIVGDTITETIICQKASAIYCNLKAEGSGGDAGEFNRSRDVRIQGVSWFEKFKIWTGILSVV